jgi:hypothetical protein
LVHAWQATLDPQAVVFTTHPTKDLPASTDWGKDNGYWTGSVVVKLSKAKVTTCQFVLGQVTPEGEVYMTMFSADTGEIVNNPLGSMVRKKGEWTMVNQMTGPSSDGTSSLSHWAYMVQSAKGDATYKRLPFAKQSIPKFMSSCPKAPPLIVPEDR